MVNEELKKVACKVVGGKEGVSNARTRSSVPTLVQEHEGTPTCPRRYCHTGRTACGRMQTDNGI